MDLDTTTLKECGLGPIVLFYSRTKRVSTAINRQADALVSAWSRPLMKRAGNYTSKYVDQLPENPEPQPIIDPEDIEEGAVPVRAPVKKKRFDVRAALEENRGRKGIRPMFNRVSYRRLVPIRADHHRRRYSTVLHHSRRPFIPAKMSNMFRGSRWTIANSTSSRGSFCKGRTNSWVVRRGAYIIRTVVDTRAWQHVT